MFPIVLQWVGQLAPRALVELGRRVSPNFLRGSGPRRMDLRRIRNARDSWKLDYWLEVHWTWSLGDVECGRVDIILVKDFKYGLDSGNFLKKILDVCYGEFGMRLDEVIWLSRRCSQWGMVEQTTMSIGINYDDWVIIGVSRIWVKVDVARQEWANLVVLDDSYTSMGTFKV